MWKSIFYNVVAKTDSLEKNDEKLFHQSVNEIYDDILALQLALVEYRQNSGQYGSAHLISFALTAYCDERLNLLALSMGVDYEMLQTRLFNTLSAGKLFYEYLEYLLAEPSQLTHTYWAYYFLLMHGYKGMYDLDSHFQRNLYLRQLKLLVVDRAGTVKYEKKRLKLKYRNISSVVPLTMYWVVPALCLVSVYVVINYL